jgi:hypothetical protein
MIYYTLNIATLHRHNLMSDHFTTSLSVIICQKFKRRRATQEYELSVTTLNNTGNKYETKMTEI